MKIGIIGDQKSITAFRALGVEVFGVASEAGLREKLSIIERGDWAVLFVTEEIMERYEQLIAPLMERFLPAVLVVPGLKGGGTKGRESLKKIMVRALGSENINLG